MEMTKYFHMNGAIEDASYSRNSGLQGMGIMKTKRIIEEAVGDMFHNNVSFPKTLIMADLGCASGQNTLLFGSIAINAVAKTSLKMGHKSPEIQINLNDLPTNDFNSIFTSLQEFQESIIHDDVQPPPRCYFTAVPGSFFDRLFPVKSLHFVHSSYSLQWLSQLPDVGEMNKGSIYLSDKTPEYVARTYYQQFQKDFLAFLRSRSKEMMAEGCMILTLAGRTTEDPREEESYYLWRPFAMALEEMVNEGHIDEEKFDSFNLPQYTASATEIMNLVEMEGSFRINHLEIFDVNWSNWKAKGNQNGTSQSSEMEAHATGHGVATAMRAVIESLVANHFGDAILDDAFMRYEKILTHRMPNKEKEAEVSITVSLIRKC